MEKRKPAYDLEGFRLEFCSVRALRMTRTAQNTAMTKQASIRCPACGGRAVFEARTEVVEYKGNEAKVKVTGRWCAACGEAVLEGPALEKRERAFLELRAKVEGVLGPKEVASIRERLGLSQRRAGEVLGGGPRAFQKYESGEQQVSVPMANLLRLLWRDPRRLEELLEDSSRAHG